VVKRIDNDANRFRQIVRGKIKQELRKYITRGELIGRRGSDIVSIPVPQIEVPRFRYGARGSGGVGQGEGEPGTPLGPGEQEGQAGAGKDPGEHIIEVELTIEELAQMLGEELELPRIEPRGKKNIDEEKHRYSGLRRAGPESLRHTKRTFKRALRRQLIARQYDPKAPRVIPIREDKVYRSWKPVEQPEANAVIFYMMDVSGSMGDEQKELVRTTAFWIDAWLRSHYKGLERRYIIHDAEASEVDEHRFYHTRESGGTRISSAYRLCLRIIEERFPPSDWNIYAFHFSDGDNWGEDNDICLDTLVEGLLPKCNLFCYGQVESAYGTGEFIRELEPLTGQFESLAIASIPDRNAIYDCIKVFLGKGR